MSFTSLISDIKSRLFGLKNKEHTLTTITPIIDDIGSNLDKLESGLYKRTNKNPPTFETIISTSANSTITYNLYDLERGDKKIISGEVVIDINGYEQCKIIENYVSIMYYINYIEERLNAEHIAIDISTEKLNFTQLKTSNVL